MFEKIIEKDGVQFGPCPFCGELPEVETDGSSVDINCCCNMSLEKSDYLTSEQRGTWNNKTYLYSDEAEQLVLTEASRKWNRRAAISSE
ncbi:hypothetical protein ACXWTF_12825 [Thiomicrolovo sp. ZZH C-3]